MPLDIAQIPTDLSSLKRTNAQYLIFFSNIVDGKPWCPDCVRIDKYLKETFEAESAPSASIVYVGERAEWKTPANPFRGAFNVQSIPTIIKVKDGEEVGRLVDDEISKSSLAKFVGES